jgi:hypothetical protein
LVPQKKLGCANGRVVWNKSVATIIFGIRIQGIGNGKKPYPKSDTLYPGKRLTLRNDSMVADIAGY